MHIGIGANGTGIALPAMVLRRTSFCRTIATRVRLLELTMPTLTAHSGIVAKVHIGRTGADDLAYCVVRLHHGQLIDFHASPTLAESLSNAVASQQRLRLYVSNLPAGTRRLMATYDGTRLIKSPAPKRSRQHFWAGLLLAPFLIGIPLLRKAKTERLLSRAHAVLDSLHPGAPAREMPATKERAPVLRPATAA